MSNKIYIIAEAGVNHNGRIDLAKKLIDVASLAGADAVKFQAFKTEHLIIDNIKKAHYQKKNTDPTISQSEMLKSLELNLKDYKILKRYCESKKIEFLITPFDEESLIELESLNLNSYKIASTDATNIPFLKKVAKTGKKIILSTGMCYMSEVERAVESILHFNKNLVLMHCTANYPADNNEVNLNVLKSFNEKFDCTLGYSDHTIGFGASLYAIPMGAKYIEKHFTLNKKDSGPDHKASLSPEELKEYVSEIRKIEIFLGENEKKPTVSELDTRKSLQKCFVAKRHINKGELLNDDNIVAKRTGGIGISPLKYDIVFGTYAISDFHHNDIIKI